MKKNRLALLAGTALMAAALMGCQKAESPASSTAPAQQQTEAPAETPAETPAEAPAEPSGEMEYESADGWKVAYNSDVFFANDTLGEGEMLFNYLGECSGTTAVDFTYAAGKLPLEVLDEKTEGIDDALITLSEGFFGGDGSWAHYLTVNPENEDPNAGDVFRETYIAVEHNGGTVLMDVITHGETDEGVEMSISDAISALLDTFELVDHRPQTEYAYLTGSYVYETTDELEGTKVVITEKLTLNDDHTCVLSIQDDISGIWTADRLYMADGSEYVFAVDGNTLTLDGADVQIVFEKEA